MNTDENYALKKDEENALKALQEDFLFPKNKQGDKYTYLCGHSLGLQTKNTKAFVVNELDAWANEAVDGHFKEQAPWYSYHALVRFPLANIVGAKPSEVVAMNGLTVNLHLMMVSFYRPDKTRFKIVIEKGAFSSDRYAVKSQLHFHGVDVDEGLIEIAPKKGEETLSTEDITDLIEKEGDSIALVLLSGVQYLTGQLFDIKTITQAAHKKNCLVGFDLAHAAGNVLLKLHDWQVDFAAWCTYKYLNAGPGSIAASFIHEKHLGDKIIPRFEGWWGCDSASRFEMAKQFVPEKSADAWQLSNPPILSLASLRASLSVFDKTSMAALRQKGDELTTYFLFLCEQWLDKNIEIITPVNKNERGNQLSLRVKKDMSTLQSALKEKGIICDVRKPATLRLAFVPLYNSFFDVYKTAYALKELLA